MVGQDQPVLVRREPYENEPEQRRPGQVEATGPLLGGDGLGVPAGDLPPRQFHPLRDDLDGPAEVLVPERRPQVGVAFEQPPGRASEPVRVEGTGQVEGDLGGVDVVLVVEGVEEQALLQR